MDEPGVSILVLMEEPLKAGPVFSINWKFSVSILVLMEEPLKVRKKATVEKMRKHVSILVLMEEPLKGQKINKGTRKIQSFNPCFNGRTT